MIRTFGVAARDGIAFVHDPATGLTHRAPHGLPSGRLELDAADVDGWPAVHPSTCGGTAPVSVCWSPIVRCNLRCPHCLDDKSVTEVGAADRRRIAHVIGHAGILGVDISGGEPLLLHDLAELADELTAAGCVVSVTTNGWHLKRRAVQLTGHVDAIKVSLDGPSSLLHDAWRGRGSFNRAVDGVREAVAAGLHVRLQTVLMASSRAFAQDMVTLAHRLGTGGVTFLQMLPIGEATRLPDGDQEMLGDDEAHALVEQLDVPPGLTVRLRTRQGAGGFTVIRADGRVWRNDHPAERISALRALRTPADLALTGSDGSA
ncbi:radical SAM protein [Spongiactinospora sp. TRM90649]|uniref:radical SAM protein n=1 Tax=Spongiactinospora sp. TRM90649 TaxID=3031114 RepID=UPI0023F8E234|nr:radical SAM protein [Spongiactinospora sp. TRM90649]MDF5759036.1 radical SAM protein [Spongiactinospora sp. TRM90649]